jgi:hypothetical protein
MLTFGEACHHTSAAGARVTPRTIFVDVDLEGLRPRLRVAAAIAPPQVATRRDIWATRPAWARPEQVATAGPRNPKAVATITDDGGLLRA